MLHPIARTSTLLVSLALSSTLLAQQPDSLSLVRAKQQATLSVTRAEHQDCPVGFSANRVSISAALEVGNSAESIHGGGLQLSFDRPKTLEITEADVTVHGSSAKPHLSTATLTLNDADTTESFTLHPKAAAALLQSNLWLRTMYAVSWVDLNSVKFSDGSTWHSSTANTCKAVPSGYQLVSAAQQPAPPAAAPAAAKTITLNVVVRDKSGPPVTGLTPQDFTLLDNKTPVQLTSVKAVTPAQEPVHVILVLDDINNSFEGVTYIRNQMNLYLHAHPHLAYPTAIALATETSTQIIGGGFTLNGNVLSDVLTKNTIGLRPVNFSAGGQGALQLLRNEHIAFLKLIAFSGSIPGRKIVIWFAPGWPLLEQTRLDLNGFEHNNLFKEVVDFNTKMRAANMTLYNINPIGEAVNPQAANLYRSYLAGVGKPYQAQVGDVSLQVESTHSGGAVLNDSTDLSQQIDICLSDLSSWYELTFTMPAAKQPDELHQLQVKVDQPHLTARTREEYYAQPTSTTVAETHPTR